MKTFEHFLNLSTLPVTWDENIFTPQVSFTKQVKYVLKRASKIGEGSSRIVVEIDYQKRSTALKVAKNKYGLEQNAKEANKTIYQKYADIVIPLISYDQNNPRPYWIHFEKADPMTELFFEKYTGFSFIHFVLVVNEYVEGQPYSKRLYYRVPVQTITKIIKSQFFKKIRQFIKEYAISEIDLLTIDNWGIYENRPVIIDMGFH
jgi:hypothetical protein